MRWHLFMLLISKRERNLLLWNQATLRLVGLTEVNTDAIYGPVALDVFEAFSSWWFNLEIIALWWLYISSGQSVEVFVKNMPPKAWEICISAIYRNQLQALTFTTRTECWWFFKLLFHFFSHPFSNFTCSTQNGANRVKRNALYAICTL